MDIYDEIAKVAYELYERSGRIEGRELDNWLEAERIVTERFAKEKKKPASKTAAKTGRKKTK